MINKRDLQQQQNIGGQDGDCLRIGRGHDRDHARIGGKMVIMLGLDLFFLNDCLHHGSSYNAS